MADTTTTSIDTADVLAIDATVARSSGSAQYGVTQDGFVAKPFARLLAEKLALARALFGDSVDLSSGSVIRKLLEISALEDARTWASLSATYDNSYIVSATGEALSRLGEEVGIPRPFLEARGKIKLTLVDKLPADLAQLTIQRGSRLSTAGGHHVATDESITLSAASPVREVAVVAFYPGPSHNLNPTTPAADGTFPQKIDRWNRVDQKLAELDSVERAAGKTLVKIEHTDPLTGGELQWPDARYRQLLLQAPRSIWSIEAIQIAASLVPGVRLAQVHDGWGGLDINQSIFGNFNFLERVFSSERDLGTPYYFMVLVAPTAGAIWDGPDGVEASVASAIEDLRPIGIFPRIQEADEVNIGVKANLVVQGLPLPTGSKATINSSDAAGALKERIVLRLRRYIEGLQFGEPVRSAEVVWTIMNEPGIADVRDLQLLRYPPNFKNADLATPDSWTTPQPFSIGQNVDLQINQIAVFVDDPSGFTII